MPLKKTIVKRPSNTTRVRRRPAVKPRTNRRLHVDYFGIFLVALGIGLSSTLFIPGVSSVDVGNDLGKMTAYGLRYIFGIGAYIFAVSIIFTGIFICFGRRETPAKISRVIGCALVILTAVHVFFARMNSLEDLMAPDNLIACGGWLAGSITLLLVKLIGRLSSQIVLITLLVSTLLFVVDKPLPELLDPIKAWIKRLVQAFHDRRIAWQKTTTQTVPSTKGLSSNAQVGVTRDSDVTNLEESDATPPTPQRSKYVGWNKGNPDNTVEEEVSSAFEANLFDQDEHQGGDIENESTSGAIEAESEDVANETKRTFQMPPTSILAAPIPVGNQEAGENEARRKRIIQCLEDFGIGAEIERISYGPTITRYEVALERGVKVSKIVSLADNIAMELAAIDVRVEAPIPGRSAIGIEVPTDTPSPVALRECIEAPEFKNAVSKLTFVLGKDVTGNVRVADLAKMPHLLVCGSTGSGKSVGLNVLITSLIYRNSPRELKFLMIDPKKVELSLYAGIPHLASPVVTNPKQAPSVFKQAIREMESRYDKFARLQTRNIEGYNSKVDELDRLPYWVIVVDELADLMMTSGPEIETSICRLAQLARATGIHLVIATQRPSVNVITGTIKANISSRIAFAVNSAVDSRTILDQVGADRLIGRGDMLFMPMDAAKPARIQGAYLSEGETEALVRFLRHQGSPSYDVQPSTLAEAAEAGESEMGHEDDLFESAVRLVVTGGSASTSMLQRRFKIGYTRAARLVDMMEQRGIVGALDGAKPREILISRDDMDTMFVPPSLLSDD